MAKTHTSYDPVMAGYITRCGELERERNDLRDALAALAARADGSGWPEFTRAREVLARIDGPELVARPPEDDGERRSTWPLERGGARLEALWFVLVAFALAWFAC